MQCVEFEHRLNRLLDQRLSPDDDEQLAAHVIQCDECAGLYHAQHRLFAGLEAGRPVAPVDLAQRVAQQRHVELARKQSARRNIRWGVLLASAASLGGLALLSLQENQQPPPVVIKTAAPALPAKPASGLAMGTTQENPLTHEECEDAVPQEERIDSYFVVLESFATQIGDSKEFDDMSESLEPSFKPIRSSFGVAIEALRRTLPRGKDVRAVRPDAGASWLPETPLIS